MLAMIKQFSLKASERRRNPQKVHAGDLGLRNAVCVSGSEDLGRRAETAVFQELLRRGDEDIYHWRGEGEVDFLVRRKGKVENLIQVVYEGMEKKTVRDREINPLVQAGKSHKKAVRRIFAARQPTAESIGIPERIAMIPLWRFLSE